MATPLLMPRQGQSVETCVIVTWTKSKGEPVKTGDIVCQVETDKAVMDVESPADGILLDIFFPEGSDVPVLTHIAAIGKPGENVDALRPEGISAPAGANDGASMSDTAVSDSVAQAQPAPVAMQSIGAGAATANGAAAAVSPRARHLAADMGLPVTGIAGTGPGGRIIERDVLQALQGREPLTPMAREAALAAGTGMVAPAQGTGLGGRVTAADLAGGAGAGSHGAPASSSGVASQRPADEVESVAVKGIRKLIADRMLSSLQTTAQLTLNASAEATALMAYRKRLKGSDSELGLASVSINDMILYALSRTLARFPDINALYEGSTLHKYRSVHLAFAVDTPRGLMVPVIRDAHRRSLKAIAQETRRLAQACLENKISPDELNGGTFTVSNLGSMGVEHFTPVLNPPQVGILGVGAPVLKPVQVGDKVEFRQHFALSLTINHQVVDGAPGACFLQSVGKALSQFDLLLAE